jgi:hypothetical protein
MMAEPDPPTSASSPPAADEPTTPMPGEDRFKYNEHDGEWCESLRSYCPGGYHPVLLQDLCKDGRYKVIRRLGDSVDATFWLVNDLV